MDYIINLYLDFNFFINFDNVYTISTIFISFSKN